MTGLRSEQGLPPLQTVPTPHGLGPLKALQAARDATGAPDALYIALGDFNDPAAQWAQQHRVAVWRAPELAQKLRGVLP